MNDYYNQLLGLGNYSAIAAGVLERPDYRLQLEALQAYANAQTKGKQKESESKKLLLLEETL